MISMWMDSRLLKDGSRGSCLCGRNGEGFCGGKGSIIGIHWPKHLADAYAFCSIKAYSTVTVPLSYYLEDTKFKRNHWEISSTLQRVCCKSMAHFG